MINYDDIRLEGGMVGEMALIKAALALGVAEGEHPDQLKKFVQVWAPYGAIEERRIHSIENNYEQLLERHLQLHKPLVAVVPLRACDVIQRRRFRIRVGNVDQLELELAY